MSTDVSVRAPVLVVEDDDANREALRLVVVEGGGYSVADVSTAQEALDYLRAATLSHVVLLDYLLPGENGDAVLRAAEREVALRRHRYLLVTAGSVQRLSEDESRLIAAVCAEVLAKPYDMDELLRAVERAVAHLSANP